MEERWSLAMNGRLPLEWDRKFGRKSLLTVGAGDPFE